VIKYTPEQESKLFDAYSVSVTNEQRDAVVLEYSTKFNKPVRSIIAKLSKMGIYISKVRQSKVTGNKPETKEQLVTKLEVKFNVNEGDFMGLEKAPKLVLVTLLK